jgi:hypothetical protein
VLWCDDEADASAPVGGPPRRRIVRAVRRLHLVALAPWPLARLTDAHAGPAHGRPFAVGCALLVGWTVAVAATAGRRAGLARAAGAADAPVAAACLLVMGYTSPVAASAAAGSAVLRLTSRQFARRAVERNRRGRMAPTAVLATLDAIAAGDYGANFTSDRSVTF